MWSGEPTFEEDKIITLKDSLAKYKYLDFYAEYAGQLPICTFPSTNMYFEIKTTNIINNLTTISMHFEEYSLQKISDTELKICNDSWIKWYWSGDITKAPNKARAVGFIYKIVSRMV